MTAPLNFFCQYKNNYFVETGSYHGAGISQAVAAGFTHVISIELSEKYHTLCRDKFKDMPNVKLILGDSALELARVIAQISAPITFWLDGHSSGGDTACGVGYRVPGAPIYEELAAIAQHPLKTHTLLIDDVHQLDKEFIAAVLAVNPHYTLKLVRGAQPDGFILIAQLERQDSAESPLENGT